MERRSQLSIWALRVLVLFALAGAPSAIAVFVTLSNSETDFSTHSYQRTLDPRCNEVFDVIVRKDWQRLKHLLDASPDCVHLRDENGRTPLHALVADGNVVGIHVLLEFEPDVNIAGGFPLLWAAARGHLDLVRAFIERGADLTVHGAGIGATPLHLAAMEDHVDVVAVLLDAGVPLEIRDSSGGTALHTAARDDAVAVLRLLLAKGAKMNARDHNRYTPLKLALLNRNVEAARLLRSLGAREQ